MPKTGHVCFRAPGNELAKVRNYIGYEQMRKDTKFPEEVYDGVKKKLTNDWWDTSAISMLLTVKEWHLLMKVCQELEKASIQGTFDYRTAKVMLRCLRDTELSVLVLESLESEQTG